MSGYPAMQTSASSLLRRLNPTIGPICKTVWEAGHIEHNRWLYDYEMVYFHTGNCRVLIDGGNFFCRAGDVIVIPPKLVHCTIADTSAERWCIHFDWCGECRAHREKNSVYFYLNEDETFDSEFSAAPPLPELNLAFPVLLHLNISAEQEMYRRMQQYFTASVNCLGDELIRQGIFLQILGIFMNADKTECIQRCISGSVHFFEAKNQIDAHFSRPNFSISGLAETLFVTPNHLAKVFRQQTGLSPQRYLLMRRMNEAVELLRNTQLPIAEIALQAGFPDANYFSRYFRRNFSSSPSAYRQMHYRPR